MFKTIEEYNERRFGGFFLLRNNGDYADVVFLYQSPRDVLVADCHYIKSNDYVGYAHCCGDKSCPACGKGIRVQTKLFIPLYNINAGEIQFWDRGIRFENQLMSEVFKNFPNPSEFVFRITRHGDAGDMNTTYSITAVGRNTAPEFQYDAILSSSNTSMPAAYESVCRTYSSLEFTQLLTVDNNSFVSGDAAGVSLPNYQIQPRPVATMPVDIPYGDISDEDAPPVNF